MNHVREAWVQNKTACPACQKWMREYKLITQKKNYVVIKTRHLHVEKLTSENLISENK